MGRVKESIMWPNAPNRTPEINQHLADRFYEKQPHRIYGPPIRKYNIVGDRVEEARSVIVYEFSLGDVEDPDLYAAHPLWEWEKSEIGQWVMNNACETPTWHRTADPMMFGYKYCITAKLMGPALTEWLLKHGPR